MKLSIITVNLNNRDGLQKTIDSVICQTFHDFEWIVIDGGSTDGSKELIEHYAAHFSYWVSEPDKGIYNAMNKGIMKSQGEYLQFLNSGDWLYDETVLNQCFSHGFTADIVYGDLYFIYANGDIGKTVYPKPLTLKFFYETSIGHGAAFIKRELFDDELYDESFQISSDWLFFLKQAIKSKRFDYIGENVCCFNTLGISSVNEMLVEQERVSITKRFFPDMLVLDFKKMDEMERLLNKEHVRMVLEYGGKNNLYHKMITGLFKLINLMEKLSCGKRIQYV